MAYLDVSPMMTALRTMPEEFEFRSGWLQHIPSRHSFKFDPEGRVQMRAECSCAFLAVRREQEQELFRTFQEWQSNYWRPLEINRQFASHFRPRSAFRRFLIDVTGRLHGWLLRTGHSHEHEHEAALAPAE
jgi:hypothetical protein